MTVALDVAAERADALLAALYDKDLATRPLWPAPYDVLTPDAAYRWLTECWWTFNEADGGAVELVPKKDFVREFAREWVECFTGKIPMVTEKSRRLVVSWMSRGLETWAMGLSRGDWLIIDQKFENAAEHLWRIHFSLTELYDRRPELNLRPHEARGAIITKAPTHIILPNGSMFTATYQEAGGTQGKGKTGITLEELSKYGAPAEFWGQALTLTQGRGRKAAERSGGWVCAIANASTNEDWHLIKMIGRDLEHKPIFARARDTLTDLAYRLIDGFAARLLPSGIRYLVIHYTADDDKRGDWAAKESKTSPGGIGGRHWLREFELNEEIYEGKPVYETYDDDRHAPLVYREKDRIQTMDAQGATYIFGWDCGSTMTPGGVLLEITPKPWQVRVLLEVTSTGNEPMSMFAPRVAGVLHELLPGAWPDVIHVGDGTIRNRMGNNGKSAADVAKEALSGVLIAPMSNSLQTRQSAVVTLMARQIRTADGPKEGFVIDGGRCPMLRKGFLGAYRIAKMKLSDGSTRYKDEPEKNEFSEPHDGLQYAAQKAVALLRSWGALG